MIELVKIDDKLNPADVLIKVNTFDRFMRHYATTQVLHGKNMWGLVELTCMLSLYFVVVVII